MRTNVVINPKYQPLWTSKARFFVVTGGRGSSKSFSVSVALVNMTYTPGHVILFTRYTLSSADISIIPEFVEKIDLMGLNSDFRITRDEIINLTTGSRIIFKGIKTSSGNQTAALKSITGLSCWVLDEAEELHDQNIFNKISRSVRSQKVPNKIIMIMNPSTKEHFIWDRFFESKNIEGAYNGTVGNTTYIHTTYKDNIENLPEDYLQDIFETKLNRPDKYEHEILGGWLEKAEGVIITDWSVKPFRELSNSCFGQDFGFSEDPSTLVHCSLDTEAGVLYVKECFGGTGLTTRELSSKNLKWAGNGIIMADNSNPRLIQEIKSMGVNIRPVKKKNGSILAGIALLQDIHICVDPDSKEIIKEFNNYVWHTNAQKPVDKFNHYVDAIRYAMTRLHQKKKTGKYVLR